MLSKIFERTDFKNEAGITLAIAPNAGRVYRSWGFDLKETGGVEALQVRLYTRLNLRGLTLCFHANLASAKGPPC